MGIGLKDIIKDDKNSLVADKQKHTIRVLLLIVVILAVLILGVIIMIVLNNSKNQRDERFNQVARDVANISNVIKGIEQQYVANNYIGELAGTPLDETPMIVGNNIEYRYGYYFLTSEDMKKIITSLNLPDEQYIVNYVRGEVINVSGVKAPDGKVYYTLDDILAVANNVQPKQIIYIHNAEEMKLLAKYPTATFYLSGDIDMGSYASGEGWEPVSKFEGILDGRNYTILNLYVNRPTMMHCGLLGQMTSSAQVKDLKLEQPNVRGGNYTGALVGSCSGNISNVKVIGGQVNTQAEHVGALVGAFDVGDITDCTADGIIVYASSYAGGLVGTVYSGNIHRCSSNSQITGLNSVGGLIGEITPNGFTNIGEVYASASLMGGQNDVGGLIGNIQIIGQSSLRLNNSYSAGVIRGGKQNIGGLIGSMDAINGVEIVIECVYSSTDLVDEAIAKGGFIGRTDIEETTTQISKCCYEKDPAVDFNLQDFGVKTGGITTLSVDAKTPDEMKLDVTYTDWDLKIWKFENQQNRPRLRWEFESR